MDPQQRVLLEETVAAFRQVGVCVQFVAAYKALADCRTQDSVMRRGCS